VQCVRNKLDAKWPGARIMFDFRCCPVCKQALEHPALKDILAPVLELENGINSKALQRLKFEGRDKDAEVAQPSGSYYGKPLEYAMKSFLFFMCFQCKRPYFAGGYQCQVSGQSAGSTALCASRVFAFARSFVAHLLLLCSCLQEANDRFDPAELICPA
jgi:hypothetical protein